MPTVIKSLRKLDVPLQIITDFDILNSPDPLRSIVASLNGEWEEMETDWKTVKASVDQKRPELETIDVKREITNILDNVSERIFQSRAAREINSVLKKASAWAQAKSIGKSFIPSGNAQQSFDRLQEKLQNLVLLVVEVGELEGFVRSIGNHGPKWVNEVLEKDLANDRELEDARRFIEKLLTN